MSNLSKLDALVDNIDLTRRARNTAHTIKSIKARVPAIQAARDRELYYIGEAIKEIYGILKEMKGE